MKLFLILFLFTHLLISSSWAADRPIHDPPMYGGAEKSHIEQDENRSKQVTQPGVDCFAKGDYNW